MGVSGRVYLPLFRHHGGTSLVHRCPAGIKMLILMVLTVLIFSGNRQLLGAATVAVVATAFAARLRSDAIFRLIRIILFYGLFIVVVRVAGKDFTAWLHELNETGIYLWKLASVFTAGMIFFETTTGVAIHAILSAFHRWTMKFLPGTARLPDFPRAFSLMLLFIPRIFESWTTLSRAWDARGGTVRKSLPAGIRKLTTLVPLLVINLLDVAATTDRAMRNRS